MSIEAVKVKLVTHCGTSAASMQLQLKDQRGAVVAHMQDGQKLGYYSPCDGCAAAWLHLSAELGKVRVL